jgi:hypothetical protein
VVKASDPIKIDGVLIEPPALNHQVPSDGVMLGEQAVVDGRKPILRPRFTHGCCSHRRAEHVLGNPLSACRCGFVPIHEKEGS